MKNPRAISFLDLFKFDQSHVENACEDVTRPIAFEFQPIQPIEKEGLCYTASLLFFPPGTLI